MLLVHLFVCFVRVSLCHFSFPLGVGGLPVVCGCSTLWTFLLRFLPIHTQVIFFQIL